MFETQLSNLFSGLKTVTELAIVSYEGFVLEQRRSCRCIEPIAVELQSGHEQARRAVG